MSEKTKSLEQASKPDTERLRPTAMLNHATTHPQGLGRLLDIQHAAGNLALQRLLKADTTVQAKVTIGAPNDIYEQEAERVADTAMRRPETRGVAADAVQTQSASNKAQAMSGQAPIVTSRVESYLNSSQGRGHPLPDAVRASMEDRLGYDFRGTRVHTDSAAASIASELNAQAFTKKQDIYFGTGNYQPGTPRGQQLLAHELTHVIQQDADRTGINAQAFYSTISRSPSQFIQRNGGQGTIVIVLGAQDPLARYSVFRDAVVPDTWRRLNNAAAARGLSQRIRGGQQADLSERDRLREQGLTEVEVPLEQLLYPQVDETGEADYQHRLFEAMTVDSPDPYALGSIIQSEMTMRWAEANNDVMRSTVRVALIDPEGELDGPPSLTFQVNDQPVATLDGALYVALVDQASSNNLEFIQAAVAEEVQLVQQGAELTLTTRAAIRKGREMIDTGHRDFSADDVNAWDGAIRELRAKIDRFRQNAPNSASFTSEATANLDAFIESEHAPFVEEHATFLEENVPSLSYGERTLGALEQATEAQQRLLEEGNYFAAANWGEVAYGQATAYGMGNILSFGYVETSRQFHEAFRGGHISLRAFEEGLENAAWRSAIVGAITFALTIATAGLAGPVLGTSASLGSQMLYWGGTSALITMGAMGAESIYTSQVTLSDPYAQQIWQQGEHSFGEIVLGGGISFGIGAAIPLVGWMANRGNAQAVRGLVAASRQGRPLPAVGLEPGLEARVISPGVVEIRQAGQQGVLRVTEQGWEIRLLAGTRETTVLRGTWGAAEVPPVAPAYLRQAPHLASIRDIGAVRLGPGTSPFGFGVTQEGWFAYASRTASPFLSGTWGEAATSPALRALTSGTFAGTGRSTLPLLGGPEALITYGGAGSFMLPRAGPLMLPRTGPSILVAQEIPHWSPAYGRAPYSSSQRVLTEVTEEVVQQDLAVSRAIAGYLEAHPQGGTPQAIADLVASLPPNLAAREANEYLERAGLMVLYRGQGLETRVSAGGSGILSPVARMLPPELAHLRPELTGLARSQHLYEQLTTGSYVGSPGPITRERLAAFTQFWGEYPASASFGRPPIESEVPGSLIDPRIGGIGIPTTRLPGIASDVQWIGEGGQGPVYVIRIPRSQVTPVPEGSQLGLESEHVIFHQIPEEQVYRVLTPEEYPPGLQISTESPNIVLAPPRRQ